MPYINMMCLLTQTIKTTHYTLIDVPKKRFVAPLSLLDTHFSLILSG